MISNRRSNNLVSSSSAAAASVDLTAESSSVTSLPVMRKQQQLGNNAGMLIKDCSAGFTQPVELFLSGVL